MTYVNGEICFMEIETHSPQTNWSRERHTAHAMDEDHKIRNKREKNTIFYRKSVRAHAATLITLRCTAKPIRNGNDDWLLFLFRKYAPQPNNQK